jgi:hypothetical protein
MKCGSWLDESLVSVPGLTGVRGAGGWLPTVSVVAASSWAGGMSPQYS